jgi:hypothetical protein
MPLVLRGLSHSFTNWAWLEQVSRDGAVAYITDVGTQSIKMLDLATRTISPLAGHACQVQPDKQHYAELTVLCLGA